MGVAIGVGTDIAGLRPGFPFGLSSPLRLMRNGCIGLASFDVPMNFWKSLSLVKTYSSALFTTSSAATRVNAAYWLTRFAVGSSSETVAVTFLLGMISSNGMNVLPLLRGCNGWMVCCAVECRAVNCRALKYGVVQEHLCCAVISAHRNDLADLAPFGIPAYLGDNLYSLRNLR